MKKMFMLLAFPLLAACASWQGRSEMDLIKHFGIPTQRMSSPEGEVFEYVECDSGGVIIPAGNLLVSSGGSCKKKMFILKDHIVTQDLGTKYN